METEKTDFLSWEGETSAWLQMMGLQRMCCPAHSLKNEIGPAPEFTSARQKSRIQIKFAERVDNNRKRASAAVFFTFCNRNCTGKQIQPAFCIPSQYLRILSMFSKKNTGGMEK